jgi:hypothetical protein
LLCITWFLSKLGMREKCKFMLRMFIPFFLWMWLAHDRRNALNTGNDRFLWRWQPYGSDLRVN